MNEQCLFIGGPDCISGTVQSVSACADYWKLIEHPSSWPPVGLTNRVNKDPFITHEYRRHNIRYGTKSNMNDHVVYFHSSIGRGDEVGALIRAAKKKKL